MVLILAARIVMWLKTEDNPPAEKTKTIDADHVKMGMEQIERRKREQLAAMMDD
jgi:hypothetical protein